MTADQLQHFSDLGALAAVVITFALGLFALALVLLCVARVLCFPRGVGHGPAFYHGSIVAGDEVHSHDR